MNTYSISITSLDDSTGDTPAELTFQAQNHDDIFAIIDRLKQANLVPETETAAFAVGLKLFSETVLHHRKEPLFSEISSAMGAFMRRLKAEARG